MGKNILAGLAGIVIAGLVVGLVEMIGHTIYPPPPTLDFTDTHAMREYISTLPTGAFLSVIVAWFAGALIGTLAACRIGNARGITFACIVGGVVLAGAAYNIAMYPHPLWVAILGIAGIVAGAWLGRMTGSDTTDAAA